eukprot:SAG11_NODE_2843_length_2915_cov_1.455966_3_plen_220_part_00
MESCRQVDVLVQRAEAAACFDTDEELHERIQMIGDECCSQSGENVCINGGSPSSCNAACSLAFTPYYVDCIASAPITGHQVIGTSYESLRVYENLDRMCSEQMSPNQTAVLLSMVRDLDMDPACEVDTSSILTQHDAKAGPPPCETDASEMCTIMISSGQLSCKDDFCPLCTQPHTCDNTCQMPCAESSQPVDIEICATDATPLCSVMLAAGSVSCRDE